MRKRFGRSPVLILILVFVLGFTVFMIAGCGKDEPEEIEKQEIIFAVGHSGTTGSSYAKAINSWLKECYSEDETKVFRNHSEDNPVIDMKHIGNGEAGLAMVSGDIVSYAEAGDTYFDAPVTDYTVLAECFTTEFQLIVRKDSGIHALADLSGKKVYCGEEGSETALNFEKLMNAAGIEIPDLQYMDYGDAVDNLTDGGLDAIFVLGNAPLKKMLSLAVTDGIRLIGMDDDLLTAICEKYDYFTKETIPAGSYEGQDEEVTTLGIKTFLVAGNTALTKEFQAEILGKIKEGLEAIKETCPAAEEFKAL